MINFAESYVTFFTKPEQGRNIARIHIDAACTLALPEGSSTTYYLIAPCRAEHMYLEARLFQEPNYEFCGIFSDQDCMLIRTHHASDRDNHELARNTIRFERVHLAINEVVHAVHLTEPEAIVKATLTNRPLVARTELRDEQTGLTALLEYPVKTMNVTEEPTRFQVDTGPVIVPDFSAHSGTEIERFDMAYVVYHQFDRAEFILRRPVSIAECGQKPVQVTDYSVIHALPARNEIWSS